MIILYDFSLYQTFGVRFSLKYQSPQREEEDGKGVFTDKKAKGEIIMCKSFETISGRRNRGNKGYLEGIVKVYKDAGRSVAIAEIINQTKKVHIRLQLYRFHL